MKIKLFGKIAMLGAMILATTFASCTKDDPATPKEKITLGEQSGELIAGRPGTATFPVAVENIADDEIVASDIKWIGTTEVVTPAGITPSVSMILYGEATVTMESDGTTEAGVYEFELTMNGVVATGTLTVSAAPELYKAVIKTTHSEELSNFAVAGSGEASIDWGDGSPIEVVTLIPLASTDERDGLLPTHTVVHTYTKAGAKEIVVTTEGNLTGLCVGYTNNATSVDVSKAPALELLYTTMESKITSLDLSNNPELKYLACGYNSLSNLDLSNNPALKKLYCGNNRLTSLDVSNCPDLAYINFDSNRLGYDALKTLFASLPDRSGKKAGELSCLNNQGWGSMTQADTDVAENKNWEVYGSTMSLTINPQNAPVKVGTENANVIFTIVTEGFTDDQIDALRIYLCDEHGNELANIEEAMLAFSKLTIYPVENQGPVSYWLLVYPSTEAKAGTYYFRMVFTVNGMEIESNVQGLTIDPA